MSRWNEYLRHVRKVPRGCVASYGQIAEAAGHGSGNGRQVGYALNAAKDDRNAWHRVLNRQGVIRVRDAERQRDRLVGEGVSVEDGRVPKDLFADAATLRGARDLGIAIERGDPEALRAQILDDPESVDRDIAWYFGQDNRSRPLHYVSDAFFFGWLGSEALPLVEVLLAHGAAIDGDPAAETPLIAACSLGAEDVALHLIEAGADVDVAGVQGATALHRAARVGLPGAVAALLDAGAHIDPRDREFDATPLGWAVHAHHHEPRSPKRKGRLAAIRVLARAGAPLEEPGREGPTIVQLADAEVLEILRS